ncbi:MAG: HD domain-containing protein [Gammaproteobacteria bacterium]|nr:HD domain-containing protein [Gammaproteobacteria bacterium]
MAKVRGKVVGQGGTPRQALLAAKAARAKEILQVEFVPSGNLTQLPAMVQRVKAALPPDQEIYLVGGAVRDLLLGREVKDFDFLVPEKAIQLGRGVANALKADFYPLDPERGAGRVIVSADSGRITLDFITIQGADIDSDLAARDLTINAMAIDLRQPNALLDPFGGAGDLLAKQVKACSPKAFQNDPVRIIRAVRMAAAFGMRIDKDTRAQMRAATGGLPAVSAERLRDEFFKLLAVPHSPSLRSGSGQAPPGTSIRALDLLGALDPIFPEIPPLRKLEQPSPHAFDVWNHILQVLNRLDRIMELLGDGVGAEGAGDMQSGLIFQKLGRYRKQFKEHLGVEPVPDHSRLTLLYFATLFHDVGKGTTQSRDENGRIHFYDHENAGAEMVVERAQALHLSNDEIAVLETIMRHHGRPYMLTKEGGSPSRRAIYRFFRDAGATGVEICLLSLADFMGKFEAQVPKDELEKHLEALRTLLEAYFEHPGEQVVPPALINGEDLMRDLGLKPGPKIGELLEAVREAQAAGEVGDREGALQLARQHLKRNADERG